MPTPLGNSSDYVMMMIYEWFIDRYVLPIFTTDVLLVLFQNTNQSQSESSSTLKNLLLQPIENLSNFSGSKSTVNYSCAHKVSYFSCLSVNIHNV